MARPRPAPGSRSGGRVESGTWSTPGSVRLQSGRGLGPGWPRPRSISASDTSRDGANRRTSGRGALTTSPPRAPAGTPQPATGRVEDGGQQQALAPHRGHTGQALQPGPQPGPGPLGPGRGVLCLHHGQGGPGRRHGQRLAAEGAPVVTGHEGRGHLGPGPAGPDRHPVARGPWPWSRCRAPRPRCWKPNQRPVRPRPVWTSSTISRMSAVGAQLAQPDQVVRRGHHHPGLPQDRLHQHRGHPGGRHRPTPWRRGRRRAHGRSRREGAGTAACFSGCPVAARVARVRPWKASQVLTTRNRPWPAHLRASLMAHSLASAPELPKNTCPPARSVPPPISRSRVTATSGPTDVAEQVGHVGEGAGLLGDGVGHRRVGVAERGHGQSRQEVEVGPARRVVEHGSPRPGRR